MQLSATHSIAITTYSKAPRPHRGYETRGYKWVPLGI